MKKTLSLLLMLLNLTILYADDIYEPNDTLSTAQTIKGGSYSLNAEDEDWFRLELASGDITITMTPSSYVDLNMVLYNSSNQIVAANFSSLTETITYEVVTSGDYYLKIYPTGSNTTNYTLDIEIDSLCIWRKELDFGPIRDVSVALFDIDKDGKDEIFVGTSKALDSELNEIRPAALICLEDDGTVKWTKSFEAVSFPDPQTGKTYNTTSVSTTPYFADIDNDGEIDILIGVGADIFGEAGADVVGQPGDKGGVYALNSDGSIKWFHQSLDTIGGSTNTGDSRPDGVFGTPVVFDIDKDGTKEVIYNSWDQYVWILNGEDGSVQSNVHLLDTIWSTPKVADINKDGNFEILVTADITENSDAGTQTGGIFHVLSSDLSQNVVGFDQFIGNSAYRTLKGKYEDQALWSSPITADIDGDGYVEILYGTGNYFHDDRGQYIRVWEHDGTNKFQLATVGRTFSTPLVADIDNDGDMEILATTLEGYLFCWDHTGTQVFATQTLSYKATTGNPIFSSPVAVDLDNDGYLEILYAQGAQVVIVNYYGQQISDKDKREMVFEQYKGSVAVKDIDNDGVLNIISGGTTTDKDQAVVYNWKQSYDSHLENDEYNIGRYQLIQSTSNIQSFVKRFYQKVLSRDAEAGGLIYWTDELVTGVRAGSDVARGFIFSQEFINRDVSDDEYLTILYQAFFNREPDNGGFTGWKTQLENGATKSEILDGFLYSQEFSNLCSNYGIIPVK